MKHRKMILVLLILIGCLILVGNVLTANDYAIGRSIIGGGGQKATGGDFILNGTIGEPVASALNVGPAHGLMSGFWWSREFEVYLPLVMKD